MYIIDAFNMGIFDIKGSGIPEGEGKGSTALGDQEAQTASLFGWSDKD